MAGSLLLKSVPMESYDHIILTSQEQEEALRLARRAKHLSQESERYYEKVRSKPLFRQLSKDELRAMVIKTGRDITPSFVIDEENEPAFEAMVLYFSGDKAFEGLGAGYSLNKGLLVLGPVGCGKTTLLRAFAGNSRNAFCVVSCRKVVDEYSKTGAIALDTYSSLKPVYAHQYYGQTGIGYGFDDLGTEEVKKHFGNEVNTMAEIILNRYDNLGLKGKTHITSNLTISDVEERYGSRVRSRLREMCNLISFNPSSADRRK